MARGKVLTVQRTMYLTDGMATQLDQLAARRGQGCKANDLVREALRAFLDEQAEVMASRRHFQKTFKARMDNLRGTLPRSKGAGFSFCQVLVKLLDSGW